MLPPTAVTEALLSTEPGFQPIDQLGLLADNMALAYSGYQPLGGAIDLLAAVPKDANPLVATAAAGSYSQLASLLDRASDAEGEQAQLLAMVQDQFGARLAALGYDPKDGEPVADANLRSALLGVMSAMGDPAVDQPLVTLERRDENGDWAPATHASGAVVDSRGPEIELLLEVHPAHADLLHQSVLNHLGSGEELDARSLERLERYCEARPSDPLGHRLLAEYWLGRDPRQAVDHVEILAHSGGDDPAGWMELARVHRKLGQPVEALAAAEAAITIDPYNPVLRERVAAFAIEAGDLDVALSQVEALMLLEPNQPRHQKRMEAIRSLQERSGG